MNSGHAWLMTGAVPSHKRPACMAIDFLVEVLLEGAMLSAVVGECDGVTDGQLPVVRT